MTSTTPGASSMASRASSTASSAFPTSSTAVTLQSAETGKKNGLAKGAIGGVVADVLGGLAMISAIVLILGKRRKKAQGLVVEQTALGHPFVAAEMQDTTAKYEAPGKIPATPAQYSLVELDSGQPRER
jgi:hypothetical protein